MRLTVAETRDLLERAMRSVGHTDAEAALIADHLLDCELRGIGYGGVARAISIVERLKRQDARKPIRVTRETSVSALVEGGDQVGYLVAHKAMEVAIAKTKQHGLAIVASNDTWYTGMLSYFAEMAVKEGLVAMIASNATPWVAPHGATEGRFGTNPICFGFPTDGDPVIWDIGTSAIMHAELMLHQRLGTKVPEGLAFDRSGKPTQDPREALAGAMAVWGGHKGSGLAVVVQLLGAMCGSPAMPMGLGEFGCLFVVMSPGLFMDADEFRKNVSDYAESVRAARPVEGGARCACRSIVPPPNDAAASPRTASRSPTRSTPSSRRSRDSRISRGSRTSL